MNAAADGGARTGLEERALAIRRHVLDIASRPEGTHVGGSLSCAEILAALYFRVLRLRPSEPDWPDRDVFVLSKGHASAALYAALAERGFFDVAELRTYAGEGSRLAGHPLARVPGVDFATGSLGHGLALAAGAAIAARSRPAAARAFVLMGDGELQEGSVWEAALVAANAALGNLVAIVDRNGLQITGQTERYVALRDLAGRWLAFGWDSVDVDGHDTEALVEALARQPHDRPRAVIAHTVKGRGVPFLENRKQSHYVKLSPALHARARAALDAAARQ